MCAAPHARPCEGQAKGRRSRRRRKGHDSGTAGDVGGRGVGGRLAGRDRHEGGGYGLIGDIVLRLVGSIVGSWIFRALGVSRGAGLLAAVVVAFIGAVLVIVAGRALGRGRGYARA